MSEINRGEQATHILTRRAVSRSRETRRADRQGTGTVVPVWYFNLRTLDER